MPQFIKATANIEIPEGFKIVNTNQLGTDNESLLGRTWTMKELRSWMGNKSADWIKKYVIYNSRFSREIQQMMNDKLIIESKGNGSPWFFNAYEMAKFLDKHWTEFDWRASK